MTVRELIEELSKHDPDRKVILAVSWAADTAITDNIEVGPTPDEEIDLLMVSGWMPNCDTNLHFQDPDEEQEDITKLR